MLGTIFLAANIRKLIFGDFCVPMHYEKTPLLLNFARNCIAGGILGHFGGLGGGLDFDQHFLDLNTPAHPLRQTKKTRFYKPPGEGSGGFPSILAAFSITAFTFKIRKKYV